MRRRSRVDTGHQGRSSSYPGPLVGVTRGVVGIGVLLVAAALSAKPLEPTPRDPHSLTRHPRPGVASGSGAAAALAGVDTTWTSVWTFDSESGCDASGWTVEDLYVQNDGSLYWSVNADFTGVSGVVGNAAVLNGGPSTCWVYPNGYDNDWFQGIRILYSGSGYLSFDYALDSEAGFDFLMVEIDEECTSFDDVDRGNQNDTAQNHRDLLWSSSGLQQNGRVDSLAIADFGTTETHCLYIGFQSDAAFSPADGLHPPTMDAALVVDNIELTGVDDPVAEDFEQQLHALLEFVNMRDTKPYGLWARLFPRVADVDPCDSNRGSCSWVFTDPNLTTSDSSYAYGPGGSVTDPLIENALVSPWIDAPAASEATVLSYRFLGGNDLCNTGLGIRVGIRGRKVDGNTITCTTSWIDYLPGAEIARGAEWKDSIHDLSNNILPEWDEIQVRLRVGHTFCPGSCPCSNPTGPGPYIERVQVGQLDWCGPRFVTRYETTDFAYAQDGFPTVFDSLLGYHRPSEDLFGTVAFSSAKDVGQVAGPPIPGDSIAVKVEPGCSNAAISSVEWYGTIVRGPHALKAPPPHTVGANGFFSVPVQQNANQRYYVDLDDDYFRGGDQLQFFWVARDVNGGFTSWPPGLMDLPSSVEEAQRETEGLFEWSALPGIHWDANYLLRISQHPSGKLEPTPQELANSSQFKTVLLAQQSDPLRRAGRLQRTPLMFLLDLAGLEDSYDVYDLSPGRKNQLASRATVEMAAGYQMIIYDTGDQPAFPGSGSCFTPLLPDSIPGCGETVNQARWFQEWLANAPQSELGRATLWMIGSNIAEERAAHPLLADNMGVTLVASEQSSSHHPDVVGQGTVTWWNGTQSDFTGDDFVLEPGCHVQGNYDALEANGTATVAYRFGDGTTAGSGAMVTNSNPAEQWNTILSSWAWPQGYDADGFPDGARLGLVIEILAGTLDYGPIGIFIPTDVPDPEPGPDRPRTTKLLANQPNPSNPETVIRFDLARSGRVSLTVYDVAGRQVRALHDAPLVAGFDRSVRWDGRDDAGRAVASGVYVYRLETVDHASTRKLVLIK